ncbi:uncharacterized protein ColSpa_01039 [Colletotrichum spaethianum]|uniref:Uncharacterized protein n=1 Tax=Colletotrichum spaethianum TaxID=700344 RepID=A0AA37L2P3_9PEZI|nr:uncharacterized protein ColSpa_01039 [Colletotrichum spaethianum]GKT40858.1 hypothetical protein ColSpa_01039 [Colletotrichum spaethianum]
MESYHHNRPRHVAMRDDRRPGDERRDRDHATGAETASVDHHRRLPVATSTERTLVIDPAAEALATCGATLEPSTSETAVEDRLEATALHHHPRSEREAEVSIGLAQTERRSDGISARVVITRSQHLLETLAEVHEVLLTRPGDHTLPIAANTGRNPRKGLVEVIEADLAHLTETGGETVVIIPPLTAASRRLAEDEDDLLFPIDKGHPSDSLQHL